MKLARVMTGVLTRNLEAGASSAANSMLKEVIPFLLSPAGLESSAPDVQAFALETLLQIVKSSNAQMLRLFIPDLIGRLLALLSSLEPQAVHYIRLNADKYNMKAQEIDDARLRGVGSSPMLEAIERCVDMLDEATARQLQPTLEKAIKTVIGLPSKVGVSRVLVSMVTRKKSVLHTEYADALLKLLRTTKQFLDRNQTIALSFATASGYLARIVSDEEILKLSKYCTQLYFDADEERHRVISGEIILALSKRAAERMMSLAGSILPFVFVAKHDIAEGVSALFQEAWNESVGGSRAVLLHLSEIVALATPYLASPRWADRQSSAAAIADIVQSAGSDMADEHARTLWPALEQAISGKTWHGKEAILSGLLMFAKKSKLARSDNEIAQSLQVVRPLVYHAHHR